MAPPKALALLLIVSLAGCGLRDRPLWAGSKYTERQRHDAILRALAFIQRSADNPANFAAYSSDYVYCFYSIAATARDPVLASAARRAGVKLGERWAKLYPAVPAGASADDVADLVFGWFASSELGQSDARIKPALRTAATHFNSLDFLLFDPTKEPPPDDIPDLCPLDSTQSPRGATKCKKCGRPLKIRPKYDIWLDALIATYTGDRYGIPLGASYADVLRWIPAMRPYPDRGNTIYRRFIDSVYSVTHVVYTLNDYGRYLLPRGILPEEFSYLKRNLPKAIALNDAETMGEFLDSLKSFGLTTSDPQIRSGIAFLLDNQRPNGTWTAPDEKDPYTLYHSAWTGIDGLKDCRPQGERLSFPEVRPLLK
jgi:hypothetical protein